MIVGIDASNIRSGGGVTHLVELLSSVNPDKHNIEKIIVWASLPTLRKIETASWIVKKNNDIFEKSYFFRALWQKNKLSDEAKFEKCDILYVPGGSFVSDFYPVVTMNRNLLPFEWREIARYGISLFAIKLILLRLIQIHALKNADGVIFLTSYAKRKVMKVCGKINGVVTTIPHGINKKFFVNPSDRIFKDKFSKKNPCRVVYVSTIDFYKHQNNVIDAINKLVNQDFPIVLDLIGSSYKPALKKISRKLRHNKNIRYLGPIEYNHLRSYYKDADIAIFASSCETFGQIVVEKMSASLPIACSNRSCMPDILGDAGIYFNPENVDSIITAVKKIFLSKDLRMEKSQFAYQSAHQFSWDRCAQDTFNFIEKIYNEY